MHGNQKYQSMQEDTIIPGMKTNIRIAVQPATQTLILQDGTQK